MAYFQKVEKIIQKVIKKRTPIVFSDWAKIERKAED